MTTAPAPTTSASYRELGVGTAVICIHSSAGSSAQWRALMERLADRFRVVAVDLYGSGKTGPWPGDRPMRLDDELELLRPVFDAAGEHFHLVGHSFGAAVALKGALGLRGKVDSLVLYEPALFSVLVAARPQSDATTEIVGVREDTDRMVEQGAIEAAAARFIDYWMGDGAWDATPAARKPTLAQAMRSVIPEWQAAFEEPTPLQAFAAVDAPTLLLTGTASKASARSVVQLLAATLPRLHLEEIEGVGHMAPVTNPEQVNSAIERFLVTIA